MKNIYFIAAIIMFILSFSCEKDEEKPLVLSTEDVTLEATTNVMEGDTVGIVPGTSNRGTINYTIASQSPEGAFRIGDTYGELIVTDATLFDPSVNPTISLVVNVVKESLSKTSNVTINVVEGSGCPDVDLTPWIGNLVFDEDDLPSVEGVTVAGDCGILTLTAVDFVVFLCTNETETLIRLIPSDTDDSMGTVVIDRQDFSCSTTPGLELEGTGTYNSNTGVMTIDYTVFQPDVDPFTGIKTVNISGSGNTNTDTDGDGVVDTEDSAPENPCMPAQSAGYEDYDLGNTIWGDADCDGDGLLNADEALDGTDPYESDGEQTDTDGDGVIDTEDSAPENPCLPAQMAGYNGYDVDNTTWAAADCDGDGTTNGDEAANNTDPYEEETDGGGCDSTANTTIWNGEVIITEGEGDDAFDSLATGMASCGTLILNGDLLGYGCDAGTPSITYTFTPESDGATNGTVVAARQEYNDCSNDFSVEYEAMGTYDESTKTISLDFTIYEDGFDDITSSHLITVP